MSESFDVHALTDDELESLRRAVLSEKAKRKEIGASPEKIEAAIAEYQVASGKGQGEGWERPVTALQAYRAGAEVEHGGERWLSTHPNNTGEPGISGWRLKPELDEDGNEIPPRYVQPAGAHDGYPKGRRITWEDGLVYEAARDGVAHSPAEYAPDWILVEAEPDPPEDEEPVEPEEPGEDEEDDEPEPEPEEPAPAEWEQRYGHNTYQIGDRVTFQGSIYVSVIPNNSWSPADHPDGWEKEE